MAGGKQKYSVVETGNIGFGQVGSVFVDASTSSAIKPPTDSVFVAITFLEDTVFDSTGGGTEGLKAENSALYVNTEAAAHSKTQGNATTTEGELGAIVDASNTFPQGATIFGRWTEIDITSGMLIAYIG